MRLTIITHSNNHHNNNILWVLVVLFGILRLSCEYGGVSLQMWCFEVVFFSSLKLICILKLFVLKNWSLGFSEIEALEFLLLCWELNEGFGDSSTVVVRRSPAAAVVLRKRFWSCKTFVIAIHGVLVAGEGGLQQLVIAALLCAGHDDNWRGAGGAEAADHHRECRECTPTTDQKSTTAAAARLLGFSGSKF
jgi:hypothetical protein